VWKWYWQPCITNFMGHNLAIIVMRNFLFIGSYGIDTNLICLFLLFKHKFCVSICVVYTWKSCKRLPCLNNAWHLCVNNTNPWNNRFFIDLERTHEAYKFVMWPSTMTTSFILNMFVKQHCLTWILRPFWTKGNSWKNM
jgi:hypothetical protein